MAMKATWREHWSGKVPLLMGPDFHIEPVKTALVIIDMQYSMAHRDYGWGKILLQQYPSEAEYFLTKVEREVVPNIQKMLGFFRRNGLRVIYITVGPHLPDYSDFLPLRRLADERIRRETGIKAALYTPSEFEHQVLAEIAPREDELVLNKVGRSAFASTGLNQILKNMQINCIVTCGVATNACVGMTACDATDLGYQAVMVGDACATHVKEFDDGWLRNFELGFGKVLGTDELEEAMESGLRPSSAG